MQKKCNDFCLCQQKKIDALNGIWKRLNRIGSDIANSQDWTAVSTVGVFPDISIMCVRLRTRPILTDIRTTNQIPNQLMERPLICIFWLLFKSSIKICLTIKSKHSYSHACSDRTSNHRTWFFSFLCQMSHLPPGSCQLPFFILAMHCLIVSISLNACCWTYNHFLVHDIWKLTPVAFH